VQVHPNRWGGELVRFENVGLRYGAAPETLTDISFSILPQSFQFLTGASGSGKTTILRLILQSLKPTRGMISIFGQDTAQLDKDGLTALRRRMGIVFKDFRLLDHLTIYENVALPFKIRGRMESSYRAEVIELLKWIGLGDLLQAKPPVLSGGEKVKGTRPGRISVSRRPNCCAMR
jgi:cell division transport system ATP-binding protein